MRRASSFAQTIPKRSYRFTLTTIPVPLGTLSFAVAPCPTSAMSTSSWSAAPFPPTTSSPPSSASPSPSSPTPCPATKLVHSQEPTLANPTSDRRLCQPCDPSSRTASSKPRPRRQFTLKAPWARVVLPLVVGERVEGREHEGCRAPGEPPRLRQGEQADELRLGGLVRHLPPLQAPRPRQLQPLHGHGPRPRLPLLSTLLHPYPKVKWICRRPSTMTS